MQNLQEFLNPSGRIRITQKCQLYSDHLDMGEIMKITNTSSLSLLPTTTTVYCTVFGFLLSDC